MGFVLKFLVVSLCILSTLSADISYSKKRSFVSKQLFREMLNAGLFRDIENDPQAVQAKFRELRNRGRQAKQDVSPFDECESACNRSDTAMSCDCMGLSVNITQLMMNISQQIGNGNKNFNSIYMTNVAIQNIMASAFGDITTADLHLDRVTGLQRISTTAFAGLQQRLNDFYLYGDQGYELENEPPNWNLWTALNSLTNLNTLDFALGFHIAQQIPDSAFSQAQNNLSRITFESEASISRIGNGAFAALTNLQNIDLSFQSVYAVAAQAFRFNSQGSLNLTVHLEYSSLNDQTFQAGAFTGRNRVINCIITGNSLTLLPENVFADLINNNPRGTLHVAGNPLNCNQSSQFAWLWNDLANSRARVMSPTCSDGRSLWDINPETPQTTTPTSTTPGGSTASSTVSQSTVSQSTQPGETGGSTQPTQSTTPSFANNVSVNKLLLLVVSLLSLKMILK